MKLTQRMMVYENLVSLITRPVAGTDPSTRRTHQQIDFDIFLPLNTRSSTRRRN